MTKIYVFVLEETHIQPIGYLGDKNKYQNDIVGMRLDRMLKNTLNVVFSVFLLFIVTQCNNYLLYISFFPTNIKLLVWTLLNPNIFT